MGTETLERVVAIIGRPNVGKSALFNRVVGRRVAIVHSESGVTRDRLACEAIWEDKRFELIDTGGVGLMQGTNIRDTIIEGIHKQVDLAISDAAVVLFVVDLTAGIVPLDQDIARRLHASNRKVLLVANKADSSERDLQAAEFEALGFSVFPVSALHGRGISTLLEVVTDKLPPAAEKPEADQLRIAVVGRPNAGKSSYINRLLRSERVIVSEIPGTTRDSIEIPFTVGSGPQARHYLLMDTAGMRKAGKANTAVEKFSIIRTENSIRQADVVVLMLDATEGPTRQDKKMLTMIEKNHCGAFLLVNKWDLAEGITTQRKYGTAFRAAMPFMDHIPVLFASAKTGYNIRKTVEAIDFVATQINTTISTGLLNRVIRDAHEKTPSPRVGGRRLKIFYVTQVGTNPVRIRLFVNSPKLVKPAYRNYLLHALRNAFGLEGAPVLLQFRSRHAE